jgi:hypothetical protein
VLRGASCAPTPVSITSTSMTARSSRQSWATRSIFCGATFYKGRVARATGVRPDPFEETIEEHPEAPATGWCSGAARSRSGNARHRSTSRSALHPARSWPDGQGASGPIRCHRSAG